MIWPPEVTAEIGLSDGGLAGATGYSKSGSSESSSCVQDNDSEERARQNVVELNHDEIYMKSRKASALRR